MKKIVIIGAGELGSRHLQGLLNVDIEQIIYVLDPSTSSLLLAEKRANEIKNRHTIFYISDWDKLPLVLDLVIVATGANVREKVVKQLLNKFKVHYLVLEKILFQDIESYTVIANLLESTNTTTWVNHPRRMMSHWQKIREEILASKEKVAIQVAGGNWGLACNGLHFLDIISFLTNSQVEILNTKWIDPIVHESKRSGYIEFTGSIKGKMQNESSFVITSFEGKLAEVSIIISSSSNRWFIQEGRNSKVIHFSKELGFKENITAFETLYQSSLTTEIANSIFETTSCSLPTYKEACASHIPFVSATLDKYQELTGEKITFCPIT